MHEHFTLIQVISIKRRPNVAQVNLSYLTMLWPSARAFTAEKKGVLWIKETLFFVFAQFSTVSCGESEIESVAVKEESPVPRLCFRWRASSKFRKTFHVIIVVKTLGSNVVHRRCIYQTHLSKISLVMLCCTVHFQCRAKEKKWEKNVVRKSWHNLSTAYVCLLMIFRDCHKDKSIKSWVCEVFSVACLEVCEI